MALGHEEDKAAGENNFSHTPGPVGGAGKGNVQE